VVFITAVGIILAQHFTNSLWMGIIPVASILVAGFAVAMIERELRRKDYARR
jgi:hypothetical protein